MDYWWNHRSSIQGICLLACMLCGSTTALGAAGTAKSRPASNRRASPPARSAASVPNQAAVTDPCTPSAMTMQTKAAPEPARHSTSALASLVTRAKSQPGASPTDPAHGGALALDLWSSRISAPETSADAETSLALKRLIHQVHALAVNDKNAVRPPAPTAEPPRAAGPPKGTPTNTGSVEPAQAQAAATTISEITPMLSPDAQKTLNDLQKNPSRVGDPLEAAELLFLSGRPTDAAPFYQEALRRTRAGEAASAGDRAWILFQLGNCLRETDTAKAQDAYAKLIAEFPNSPWTEMARAGSRLLTWYQSTRPDQLMTARKP